MSSPAEAPDLPAGYRLRSFESIDSTNAEALRRMADGAQAGDVIWAQSQTGGRGRRGRQWQSPAGNLYLTLALAAPERLPVGQLAFIAALGAGEAVNSVLSPPAGVRYKWPNDLMLEGRKLGGILIEGAQQAPHLVAVGLGINVASSPAALEAASMRDAGADVSVRELMALVCRSVDRWDKRWRREGFGPVRDRWVESAYGLGEAMEVHFPDGSGTDGVFGGIDSDGALVLNRPDGGSRHIATGEVFFASA